MLLRRTAEKDAVLFGERKSRNTPWRRERSREEPSLCRHGVAREGRRGPSISFAVVVLSEKKPVEDVRHRVKKTMKRELYIKASSKGRPSTIREVKALNIGQLVRISGIVWVSTFRT
ncbi:hypothetical protein GLYMA_03G024632v4 [Glycine max]|nr:hypothetical protein GLYMA_03G024632v4 [Glycine max]KAH1068341.1 hypothetical protein GYH30_006047 [Glycine max]